MFQRMGSSWRLRSILVGLLVVMTTALDKSYAFAGQDTRNGTVMRHNKGGDVLTYTSSAWGFSFKYPHSWTAFSKTEFIEKTHGQWNVPGAVVVVINNNDNDENFIVKAYTKGSGLSPERLLDFMEQQYSQTVPGFNKISSTILKKPGISGIDCTFDSVRDTDSRKLRQRVVTLETGKKALIITFTSGRGSFQTNNNRVFNTVIDSINLQ